MIWYNSISHVRHTMNVKQSMMRMMMYQPGPAKMSQMILLAKKTPIINYKRWLAEQLNSSNSLAKISNPIWN